MKIVRPSLNILIDKLADLGKAEQELRAQAEKWSEQQKWRDEGYGVDQYHVQYIRNGLEGAIIEYRKQLAEIYDFMGDKGLV
jgi:hypothetical protein